MNTDLKIYKPTAGLAIATGLLLLIPLIAMQFSDEVVWTLSDFILAGALIFGTGFTYILITRVLAPKMGDNILYRVAIGFALFTGFFLIWINGAVGIIGSEDNPVNILYFGVIAIGIIGAFIVRFWPKGMVYTMFAMAIAQALIATITLVGGFYQSPPSTVFHIIGVNGFFVMLFIIAGLLFWYTVQEETPDNADTES